MSSPSPSFVWLNGRIVLTARASVNVLDRGLQYGDGLFETLRVYQGKVFALQEHLARLRASARFLGIPIPRIAWTSALDELLRRNRLSGEAWVRIVLTRGPAAPGLLPPRKPRPTLLLLAGKLDPSLARRSRGGVRVELLPFATEGPLAGHKALHYLPAMLAKQLAHRHRAYEGLYVDARGILSEGATSNLFLIRGRTLWTPTTRGILPGVTRGKVIDLARRHPCLEVAERKLRAQALLTADEAFLSSSLAEIVPIIRVGSHRVGDGKPGAMTRALQAAYRRMVDETLAV